MKTASNPRVPRRFHSRWLLGGVAAAACLMFPSLAPAQGDRDPRFGDTDHHTPRVR